MGPGRDEMAVPTAGGADPTSGGLIRRLTPILRRFPAGTGLFGQHPK